MEDILVSQHAILGNCTFSTALFGVELPADYELRGVSPKAGVEYASLQISMPEMPMKRREFGRRLVAAAAAPIVVTKLLEASVEAQDASVKQANAPASRAEELKKRAEGQREQISAALRKKALPYDLEPAFVFAAKPRGRKRQPKQ